MLNCRWTAGHVVASALWMAAVTLATLALVFDPAIGYLGVVLGAAGGTLNARMWFATLEQREVAAFNLGRESVRSMQR